MKKRVRVIKIKAGKGCGKGCTLISIDELMQTDIKIVGIRKAA